MEFVYKIRHKKTGLFFNPSTYLGKLSEKARIYLKKPNLSYLKNKLYIGDLALQLGLADNKRYLDVCYEDFEICEYAIVLNEVFDGANEVPKSKAITLKNPVSVSGWADPNQHLSTTNLIDSIKVLESYVKMFHSDD